MTPLSEAQAALAELRKATLGFQQARAANPNAWYQTHNSLCEQHLVATIKLLGGQATITPKPAPPEPIPVPPPAGSLFSGKGIFTTSNASAASGLNSAWVAIQKDPEGDKAPVILNNPGKLCWWQARPTSDIVAAAELRGIPYIGQAESQAELDVCLALGQLTVPHALIGNPTSWTAAGAQKAAQFGWDLIVEWYWNAMPWQTQPDAHGYPLFRNVCFGTYDASSEHPGTGRSVSVAEYRQVWKGPFSCWPAETMTDADRIAYNAA